MRSRVPYFAAALLATAPLAAVPDVREDPRSFQRALAAAKPAADGIIVEKMRIDLGAAILTITRGTLIPILGPGPRAQEFLVFGDARFVLATDDPVESYQVELFTGSPRLDVAVTRAVLVIPNDAVADALVARPGRVPLDAPTVDAARDLLAAWRRSPEYRHAAADLAMVDDALGDPAAQGAFIAWCHAEPLGRFLYTVDPYAIEQVRLEKFVESRLGDLDADAQRKELRREAEEGRGLGRRVEDLGAWDTWFSSKLRSADGGQVSGHESFEPLRYELQLSVDADLEHAEGRARVILSPKSRGARTAHFELFADLVVTSVENGAGRLLPWARSGSTITVSLDAPSSDGVEVVLAIRYGGVLFARPYPGLIAKRASESWFPHTGTVDRATYRAELDVPESVRILGSGVRATETVEAGRRRQVRTLDVPTRFFGFEIGRYDIETRRLGHVTLEIGFLKDAPLAEQADRALVIDTIVDAMSAYEEAFGPYPLDVLNVATTWTSFSQGFLSFVTLAQPVVDDVALKRADAIERAGTIAHELAHQWWGNMVGWTSYRDKWLSEALANYSAGLYRKRLAAGRRDRGKSSARVGPSPKAGLVETRTDVGRPVEAMGPVTLGVRLSSSLSYGAFRAIVYDKGSMVFSMLADKLGEAPLLGMLREIAQRTHHRDIDTETFLRALQKMSGKDLEPFDRAFVNGVGYPEIQFTYEPKGGNGEPWAVAGTVRQIPRGFRRDRLVRLDDGRFDIAPTFQRYQPVEDAEVDIGTLVTPAEGSVAVAGVVPVRGAVTPFEMPARAKPGRLRLDPEGAVPAPVRDATLEAKRSTAARGSALRSAGLTDEAASAYREALTLPLSAVPEGAIGTSGADRAWWADRLDGSIRIALAEIALDEGRAGEAESELAAREVRVTVAADGYFDARRKILRARLALRAGNPKSAYGILSDILALDFVQKATDTFGDTLRREKFRQQREGRGGDYLLLAIAAHLTERGTVAREAATEAARRGADTSLIDEMLATRASNVRQFPTLP